MVNMYIMIRYCDGFSISKRWCFSGGVGVPATFGDGLSVRWFGWFGSNRR